MWIDNVSNSFFIMTKPAQNCSHHLVEAVGRCTQIRWLLCCYHKLITVCVSSVSRSVSRTQGSLAGGGGKLEPDKVSSLTTLSPSSPRQKERWDHTVHGGTIEDSPFLKPDILTVTFIAVDSFLRSWFIFRVLVLGPLFVNILQND